MRRLGILLVVATGCRGLLGIDEPSIEEPADASSHVDVLPDTETPAQIAERLIAEWSGCMDLNNFHAADMALQWSGLSTAMGTCGGATGCHQTGGYGFIASSNEQAFFSILTMHKDYLLSYFSVEFPPSANPKVVINTANFTTVGGAQPPHQEHATFPLGNPAMTALGAFYAATVARKTNGTCDPPRF